VFKTFKEAWKVAELRSKILFTLLILVLFRIGCTIPVPYFDDSSIKVVNDLLGGGGAFGYLNLMSGSALANGTLFALSISPYITAQIIIQLLTIAIPALERLSKEGEEGRKKIQSITRYGTVILAIITSIGYFALLNSYGVISVPAGLSKGFVAVVIVATYTAGASLVMWLAEKINEHGIGNGISLILFAGIVSGIPYMIVNLASQAQKLVFEILIWIAAIVVFIIAIAFVVFVTESERRIPVQYAKKVVGRKMYGGQSSNLPIKLNMSGVMPFIFAQSIISIPETIRMIAQPKAGGFWEKFFNVFSTSSPVYIIILFVLIIFFAYFYLAISFNPVEVANNLKKNGGTIFGIRPGKPTADYIRKVVNRITLIGALFLSVIAILPMILSNIAVLAPISLGGTSLLIAVGVAIETERELEAQMAMRNYKGFLE
jgi:preprotein translocase subunit SecY